MTKINDIDRTVNNRWENIYWFSRMLINYDKYGSVGKENKLLIKMHSTIDVLLKETFDSEEEKVATINQAITTILLDRVKNAPARKQRVQLLIDDLRNTLKDVDQIEVFKVTCENVMVPINNAIDNIPSDDKEFTLNIAQAYLDRKGKDGLSTVIKLWDDLGVRGSLSAERSEIVRAYATLRVLLDSFSNLSNSDRDFINTAFVQEFERRAGQKRKSRAGTSLEDVTDFILKYFGIKTASAPEHFQADIEIDNWIRTKDKWLIGISCKRTLRERWKQVSSADSNTLSTYKIKQVYHIVTYDEDLSDDKLTQLGSQRHIFYLPDDSRVLKKAQEHLGLKDYVRPISSIVDDIKQQL